MQRFRNDEGRVDPHPTMRVELKTIHLSGLEEIRRVLKRRSEEKGGPIKVLLFCQAGEDTSPAVCLSFKHCLERDGLDKFVEIDSYGYLDPVDDIKAKLEGRKDRESPQTPYDFVSCIWREEPKNLMRAINECSDPKPTLIPNLFPDGLRLDGGLDNYYPGFLKTLVENIKQED